MFVRVFLIVGLLASVSYGYEDKTISEWLSDNGYTTLVNSLKSTGLFSVLNAAGPFTLFAPTDAAFQNVPTNTLAKITSDPSLLEYVLKYHVLQGFLLAPLIQDGDVKKALNGQDLSFTKSGSSVMVQNATVSTSDVVLSNGVIHVIDSVLIPIFPPSESIGEILLVRDPMFSTLNMLLTLTDLAPVLLSGNFTLFAPTNDAFNRISDSLPSLSADNAKDTYADILKNHVVAGTLTSAHLTDGQTLTMLSGHSVTVHTTSGVKVNNANVITADILATNGVIHIIDTVLVY